MHEGNWAATIPTHWDGVHAFAAMKADVLRRGITDDEAYTDVTEWIAEPCELLVDCGGYDGGGGSSVDDGNDRALDDILRALE